MAGISVEKTNFIIGCPSMHIESTKSNKTSNSHLFAANKHANEQKPSEAPALKAMLSLNKTLFPKMQHLFHTVHAINIKDMPHNDYEWFCELDVAKGLDIGDCFRNCLACWEFTSAIADVQ